jgi:hypothetical protein
MRPIREFEEFVAEGVVHEQTPDHSRATALRKETESSEISLKEILDRVVLVKILCDQLTRLSFLMIFSKKLRCNK